MCVTGSDEEGVSFTWDAVAYRAGHRERGAASWLVADYVFHRTSFTVDGLDCGATYKFRVRPSGDGVPPSRADGGVSDAVSAETSLCAPFRLGRCWVRPLVTRARGMHGGSSARESGRPPQANSALPAETSG